MFTLQISAIIVLRSLLPAEVSSRAGAAAEPATGSSVGRRESQSIRQTTYTSLTPAIIAFRNSIRVARSQLNGERTAPAMDSLTRHGEFQSMVLATSMLPI